MSINTGGAPPAQQIQPQIISQEQSHHAQNTLKMAVQMINQTAGAPMDQNFLETASLDALMIAIMSDRAELLESNLRVQVQEVRTKNSKLKDANAIMAIARAAKKGSSDDDKTKMPNDVAQFFADNGIPWGEGGTKINPNTEHKLNSGEWDLAIENLKGWSEGLTSSSQLDMTKLQSSSGKLNQTVEMMSQFISKYFRSGDSIIKNV